MHRMVMALIGTLVVAACGTDSSSIETIPSTTGTATVATTAKVTTTDQHPPATDPVYDAALSLIVEQARADLVARLGIEESLIEVVSAESVTWSDGSLGCPQPGVLYTQALVDGFKVVLSHDGTRYPYHAGDDRQPFLCETDDS